MQDSNENVKHPRMLMFFKSTGQTSTDYCLSFQYFGNKQTLTKTLLSVKNQYSSLDFYSVLDKYSFTF